MKALTNILTHMLMLLLMVVLATCTNDDGADEVMPMDDGMVQLKVGMTVPNLKITTRAADEGEILTSIKGLCYDENGTLTKIADATDISTTTFNMRVPTETRIIHFLANLPGDCSLPELTTTEDALKNLTTKSSSMAYWGRTTFNATPADCNITFYRNKARIIIKAADGSSVGTVGIAGVVNAYDTGMLVPYGGAYNFDLSTNYYPTVPTEDFTKGNVMVNTNPLPTQYDVFEHPNTGTSQASSLYAICLIGSKYYKVALGISDEDGMVTDNYFRIIRNHKYVISVADVDDVDASLGADYAEDAASLPPINDPNISVKDVVEAAVTLSTSTQTLDYNNTSISNLVLSVTVPPEVNTLTLNTPGFTIVTYTDTNIPDTDTKYLVDKGNGSFTVNHPENDEEHTFSFRLQLTDKSQQSYTLSCIAASNDANVKITQPAEIRVSLNKVDDNDNVYWMGASTLDYFDSATKIPIPAEKLTKGATVTFEYEKGSNPSLSFQHASWADFENASTLELSQNTTSFEITEELYNEIQEKKGYVYNVADIGMVVQGGEITLKKITIEPAQVENVALTVNPTTASLYYDSNNTQQITVTVPVGKTLAELTITPSEDCFTITPTTDLSGPVDGVYTYAPEGGVTGPVTFTIAPSDSYNFTSNLTSDVVFDGTGVDMNVVEAKTTVTLMATPTVTFTNTGSQTLYWNNGSPTNFQVQMTGNNVPNDKTITLTITAPDFTVTAQNGTLTQNGDVWTYTGTLTTLTFTPTSSGDDKPINITGEGENVNVKEANISVDVDATLLAVTPIATTINMDYSETSTILTLTKPGNITNLKVTASNNNAFTINGNAINGDYYIGGLSSNNETINYTIALRDGFNTAGEYTITFTDNGGGGQSVTATITIVNTPSLQFEYNDNETLYLDSSPQLPVTITVPVGSTLTQLNITATGFTIKQGETTLSETGSYTYSYTYTDGTSTTFTFVPTNIYATTITFTGSGTNLKDVDETIIVTVKATKPEVTETVILDDDDDDIEFSTITDTNCMLLKSNNNEPGDAIAEDFESDFKAGVTIHVEFNNIIIEYGRTPVLTLQTIWGTVFKKYTYKEGDDMSSTFEYTFTSDDIQAIDSGGLQFVGNNITITKIVLSQPNNN